MNLSLRPKRHDIGRAPFVELSERSADRGGKLTGDPRLERDFMLAIFRNDEHQFTSDFDFRRRLSEVTLTHAYSPDSSIRRAMNASFVINLQQLNEINLPLAPSGKRSHRSGPFSIADSP